MKIETINIQECTQGEKEFLGRTLIAKNPCVTIDVLTMQSTNEASLTIGKKYKVVHETSYDICIIDDQNDAHYFTKDSLSDFFIDEYDKLKETNASLLSSLKEAKGMLLQLRCSFKPFTVGHSEASSTIARIEKSIKAAEQE